MTTHRSRPRQSSGCFRWTCCAHHIGFMIMVNNNGARLLGFYEPRGVNGLTATDLVFPPLCLWWSSVVFAFERGWRAEPHALNWRCIPCRERDSFLLGIWSTAFRCLSWRTCASTASAAHRVATWWWACSTCGTGGLQPKWWLWCGAGGLLGAAALGSHPRAGIRGGISPSWTQTQKPDFLARPAVDAPSPVSRWPGLASRTRQPSRPEGFLRRPARGGHGRCWHWPASGCAREESEGESRGLARSPWSAWARLLWSFGFRSTKPLTSSLVLRLPGGRSRCSRWHSGRWKVQGWGKGRAARDSLIPAGAGLETHRAYMFSELVPSALEQHSLCDGASQATWLAWISSTVFAHIPSPDGGLCLLRVHAGVLLYPV